MSCCQNNRRSTIKARAPRGDGWLWRRRARVTHRALHRVCRSAPCRDCGGADKHRRQDSVALSPPPKAAQTRCAARRSDGAALRTAAGARVQGLGAAAAPPPCLCSYRRRFHALGKVVFSQDPRGPVGCCRGVRPCPYRRRFRRRALKAEAPVASSALRTPPTPGPCRLQPHQTAVHPGPGRARSRHGAGPASSRSRPGAGRGGLGARNRGRSGLRGP